MKLPEKATIIKLIAAIIVPGGFVIWGLHELSILSRKQDRVDSEKPSHDPDSTEPRDQI